MINKPTITIESIPIEALVEARNTLADKYITLKLASEKAGHADLQVALCQCQVF